MQNECNWEAWDEADREWGMETVAESNWWQEDGTDSRGATIPPLDMWPPEQLLKSAELFNSSTGPLLTSWWHHKVSVLFLCSLGCWFLWRVTVGAPHSPWVFLPYVCRTDALFTTVDYGWDAQLLSQDKSANKWQVNRRPTPVMSCLTDVYTATFNSLIAATRSPMPWSPMFYEGRHAVGRVSPSGVLACNLWYV